MTAIHNLGIVIQQGGKAAEAQQIKHPQTDPSNIAASHQPARDIREQSTVQESGESEKAALRDKEGGGNQGGGEEKGGKKNEKEEKSPDSTGYIIDTLA